MTDFNVEDLMHVSQATSVQDEYVNVPEGDYQAVLDKLTGGSEVHGEDREGNPRVSVPLELHWKINDPEAAEATGRETNIVRQTIWLDKTDEGVDLSNSIPLGKVLTAFGMNEPGWELGNLQGQTAMVKIKHNASTKNPDVVYANVTNVVAV